MSNKIGLEAIEYKKWLTLEGEIEVSGGIKKTLSSLLMSDRICPNQTVQIPNTVFSYWAGVFGHIGQAWVNWSRDVSYLSSLGFYAEEQSGWTAAGFNAYLDEMTLSKDLHGILFWGHGAHYRDTGMYYGLVTDDDALNSRPSGVPASTYITNYRLDWPTLLNYRLGLGLIYACGGKYAQIGNFSSNAIFWGVTDILVPIGTPAVKDIIIPGDQGTQQIKEGN